MDPRPDSALPQLSLAEWVVLAVTAEQPVHGFAIAQLTAAGGALGRVWQVPRPIVYRALGRLEPAGLVEAAGTEQGSGPQRTIYAVTDAGRRAVAQWLATPVAHVREVRSHLLVKLALLDRAGLDPAGLVARQREVLAPIAAAMRATTAGGPQPEGFEATLLAWRRASAAAAVGFLDEISAPDTVPGRA